MDDTDVAIVLNLLASPDISNKGLSSEVGVSAATISRRIKSLQDRNIIQNKSLHPKYEALGLNVFSIIIIPAAPVSRNRILLRQFFDKHSYTAYQNSIFGKGNGLFIQLGLPSSDGVSETLESFLDELVFTGFISSYQLFSLSHHRRRYGIDPSAYNIETREFEIDYSTIRRLLWGSFEPLTLTDYSSVQSPGISTTNLRILSVMFADASLSLAEIGQRVGGISKQEVSRRLSSLDLSSWHYVIPYDREQFGVFNQVLYVLNFDLDALTSLDRALDVYPFPLSIYPSGSDILIWINLPAIDVTRFTEILEGRFNRTEMYLLGRKPIRYPVWYEMFKDGSWDFSSERIFCSYNHLNELVTSKEFFEFYEDMDLSELITEFRDT